MSSDLPMRLWYLLAKGDLDGRKTKGAMALPRWHHVTTSPNPGVRGYGADGGQRGRRLHSILAAYDTPAADVRYARAACGLRPVHGWSLDLFIDRPCRRCSRVVASDVDDRP